VCTMSHGTFDEAPVRTQQQQQRQQSTFSQVFGSNEIRTQNNNNVNTNTLDEPIAKTLKRDMDRIMNNAKNVLDISKIVMNSSSSSSSSDESDDARQPLRDWDLWGPLIFVLLFGVCLSSKARGEKADSAEVFSVVFATVAFGAFALTLNVKFLGGKIIFLQAMSLIGYCVLPLDIAALLCLLSTNGIYRIVVTTVGVVWACAASVPFISAAVPEQRRALAVYPIVLLFVTLGLFAAMVV
jgi:protein YIPF6